MSDRAILARIGVWVALIASTLAIQPAQAPAHTIAYSEAYYALHGQLAEFDNDIRIKRQRLEDAYDVTIVNVTLEDKVRVSDHLIDSLYAFHRANGKIIYRMFVSRFINEYPNRYVYDYPELPY